MTLVVGRIEGKNIFIESDSKISDENLAKHNPLYGMLKTIIISPFLCISFASNNINFVEDALKSFFEKTDWSADKLSNIDTLLNMLLAVNKKSNNTTDFALASITNGEPMLFKISNGIIERGITHFWLGNINGFNIYQREYLSLDENISIEQKMQLAFEKVINEPSLTDIGDFHISTYVEEKIASIPVFLYRIKVISIMTESSLITFNKANESVPVPIIGTAAGGSFAISYFTTVTPNFHGVAIHFFQGNLGVLFCPQLPSYDLCLKSDGSEIEKEKIYFNKNINSLEYTVINPHGKLVQGNLNELGQFNLPLNLDSIRPFIWKILKVTAKRGHTSSDLRRGKIISNVNVREFINIVKERYNIPLRGFIANPPTHFQLVDSREMIL